jgi:hypothetical protein
MVSHKPEIANIASKTLIRVLEGLKFILLLHQV